MRRLALIPLGIVLALVATEVLLRLGAAVVQPMSRGGPATGEGETILCVGDSNTYGFYLEERESYPAQLQQLLGDHVRVVNLGFPGMNSSQLLADLPTILEVTRPATVLILIGANDGRTAPVALNGPEPWASTLSRWSRAYRLGYMLWRSAEGVTDVAVPRISTNPADIHWTGDSVIARIGDQTVPLGWRLEAQRPEWPKRLADNLGRIVALVRQAGATPIMLTYPSDITYYRVASRMILQAAEPLGVAVIDLHAKLLRRCATQDCVPLFFGDGHPTAAGYAVAAQVVAEGLQ